MREIKSVASLAVLLTGLLACTHAWSEEIDNCDIGRENTKARIMCEIKKIMQVHDRNQLEKKPEKFFRPVYLKCDNDGEGELEFVSRNREQTQAGLKARYSGGRMTYLAMFHVPPNGTRKIHFEGTPDEIAASHTSFPFITKLLATVRNKVCYGSKAMKERFAQVLKENESQVKK